MSDHDLSRRKQQLLHGTLRRPVKAITAKDETMPTWAFFVCLSAVILLAWLAH